MGKCVFGRFWIKNRDGNKNALDTIFGARA
jgi:hypothetical protein